MSDKTITEREAVERERAAYVMGARDRQRTETTRVGDNPGVCVDHEVLAASDAAALLYPLPKVTRPREVRDSSGLAYRLAPASEGCYAAIEWRRDGDSWRLVNNLAATEERVRLWADLLANPTEKVEA